MLSSPPQLPEHCEPANDFLASISLTFNSCIPTPLALLSTVLGVLSILSWLFAQVPQIIKNFNLRSTSGLSVFFLGEWLLGDLSNLLGSLFTGQATWQVVLAFYYCCVDCVLCLQWVWYEHLKHGRKVRRVRWWRKSRAVRDEETRYTAAKQQPPAVKVNGVPISVPKAKPIASRGDIPGPGFSPAGTPSEGSSWMPSYIFSRPQFASYSSASSAQESPPTTPTRPIIRVPRPQSPTPSPRTVLYITLLVCLAARATPTSSMDAPLHLSSNISTSSTVVTVQFIGTLFSWLSTVLYLASRLPQLLHNASRRSTEGLSPSLFLAAFFGNLFYSTSLLTNPSLWHEMPAYGGGGWADESGSNRVAWATRAAPFFLGAAGVLLLDALVGLQFLWYAKTHMSHDSDDEAVAATAAPAPTTSATGTNTTTAQQQGQRKRKREPSPAAVLVVETEGVRGAGRWRKVSGWMRGWTPVAASSWRRDSFSSLSDDAYEGGQEDGGNSGAINRHLDGARDGRSRTRRRSSAYGRPNLAARGVNRMGEGNAHAEETGGASESDRLLDDRGASEAASEGGDASYGSIH